MEKERFVETGKSSFFGDYLYDQIVPEDHFLRKLKQHIPWECFTRRLIKLYKGGGISNSHYVIASVLPWRHPPNRPGVLPGRQMCACPGGLGQGSNLLVKTWDCFGKNALLATTLGCFFHLEQRCFSAEKPLAMTRTRAESIGQATWPKTCRCTI